MSRSKPVLESQRHRARFRRELHGVAEQVDENLPDLVRVPDDLRQSWIQIHFELQLLLLRLRHDAAVPRLHALIKVHVLQIELEISTFNTTQIENGGDELQQALT